MPPLATVVIDTYNHERFIEQAIVSVLEQQLGSREVEVLVVDDGSVDRTPEIVAKFLPRIRYLRKPNGGQASAFNAAIPEARGEVVFTLDGDDWWAPQKLQRQMEILEKHPETGIVGHGYFEADAQGRTRATILPNVSGPLDLSTPQAARQFALLRGFFGAPRMAIRRRLLQRILPVPEELVIEADEYIFALAPALAPAYLLREPLVYYRLHGGNLFQARHSDERARRRKSDALSGLVRRLPPRLAEFGVPAKISAALLEPLRLDEARARLALDGGSRRETFRVERALYRLSDREMGFGYQVFRAVALSLALLLPPRWFYRFRDWYSVSGLIHARAAVAPMVSGEPVTEIRHGSKGVS